MRNIITYFHYFLLLSIMTGCSDYFTDESDSTYTSAVVFENESLAAQAVDGIYAAMCDDELYSKKVTFYYSMNTDIENISGNTDAGRRAIARYCANSSNSEIYGPWSNLYSAIEKANNCIYGIIHGKLVYLGDVSQRAEMNKLLGEALCLRALLYFDLVKNWGDVPFHTLPTSITGTINLQPTNRHQILDSLIIDLNKAEILLPWEDNYGTTERVNKGFAKGLKARICLFNAGYSINPITNQAERPDNYLTYYQMANKECADIISNGHHSLNQSFENIFKKECSYSNDVEYYEPMFELAFGRLVSGELGYYIGTKHEENKLYGKSEAGMLATPSYFYSFDPADKRRDVTCAYYKYNSDAQQELTSITSITIAKWRKDWISPAITGSAKYTGVNFPFMRYADVLLMYAETENELYGPDNIAKNALKQVRYRAFPDSLANEKVEQYVDQLSTKEDFFNALVKERAWEFGGECIRKYDLMRWGLLKVKLDSCKNDLLNIQKREGIYSNIPVKVYWKLNADNEHIIVANIYNNDISSEYDLTNSKSTKWASNLASSFISRVYEGDPAIKQFLPIPQQAITYSNGLLTNHYGY